MSSNDGSASHSRSGRESGGSKIAERSEDRRVDKKPIKESKSKSEPRRDRERRSEPRSRKRDPSPAAVHMDDGNRLPIPEETSSGSMAVAPKVKPNSSSNFVGSGVVDLAGDDHADDQQLEALFAAHDKKVIETVTQAVNKEPRDVVAKYHATMVQPKFAELAQKKHFARYGN